ncbi:MAG TPA: penicillin-binding transpeptidase domain-containing protein [Pyrinomonadaceae bacterium]
MNNLEDVLQQTVFHAVGWALVHSLWQGAGVAALLAGLLALLRGRHSRARYAAGCAALALMLLLPATTVWKMSGGSESAHAASDETGRRRENHARTGTLEATVIAAGAVEDAPEGFAYESHDAGRHTSTGGRFEGVLPWLSLLWALGVAVFSARSLGGLIYARRLKSVGTRPAAREWQQRLAELSRQLRVKRAVRLLESTLVQVPTAVGWLRPVVLLPASALTGLTPRQLEVVLAHELAHIRRHDYLVNLLQTAVETLLFYHPAAWWVAGRVRAEREHVCDDMAVSATGGDALGYARALTALERLRPHARPQLAMAIDGGSLRSRIMRLVGAPAASRRTSPLLAGVAFAAALITTVACTGAVLSQNKKPAGNSGNEPGAAKGEAANAAREKSNAEVANLSPAMQKLVAGDSTEGEDTEVRRAALAALGKRNGSVVVMDPSTGRVYAVVNQEWALRRGWLPASTMKVIVSMAGLGERTLDPAQKVKVSDRPERINLTDALAFSNNPYFFPVSERVGSEAILAYARRLGLGEPTGINYEGETAGILPASARGTNAGRLGTHGEGVEVTPVQLAALTSAIANGGTLYVPRVPRTAEEAARFEPKVRRSIDIPREILDRITPGLLATVERGTGVGAKLEALKVAGKTGSAGGKNHSHGIFYSYAPAERPRLVVVVVMEGPAENGRESAGVAGAIYKALGSRLAGGE